MMPDNSTTFGRATEGAHIAAVTLGLMGVEDGAYFLARLGGMKAARNFVS